MNKVSKTKNEIVISLESGMIIHIRCTGKRVFGIGRVRLGDLELRRTDIMLVPILQSEDGIAYKEFLLRRIENKEGKTILHINAIGHPADFLNRQDSFKFALAVTSHPDGEHVVDTMQWIFESVVQEIDGIEYSGMAYQFKLFSKTQHFIWLMERGSWELGKMQKKIYSVAQRSGSTPYEIQVTKATVYDTSEVFVNKGVEQLCWQMMPRFAGSPAFDFQFNTDALLLMYYERPGYIGALQHKKKGDDFITHIDRHQFALTKSPTHPRKFILVDHQPGRVSLTEGRNRWTAAFDFVVEKMRAYYGYKQDPVEPTFSGTIWDSWLDKDPSKLREILNWIPKLKQYGVKTLFMVPLWVCDTSLLLKKINIPMTGGRGNLCIPWRYEAAPELGGEKLIREICDHLHKNGMKGLIWIGHWLDIDSPLAIGHPEWKVYNNDGSPFTGGPPMNSVMSMNTDFRKYVLKQYLGFKKRTGLDGFFLDSYHNLVFSPINYGVLDKAPQVDAVIDYQVRLQKAGAQMLIESQGIFGVSLNWFHPGKEKFKRKGAFEDFFGQEYTLKNMLPCIKAEWIRDGIITDDFIYRTTACGSPIRIEIDFQYPAPIEFPDYAYTGRLGAVNQEYNQVHEYMQKRRLLESDRGVEWTNSKDDAVVLFAFKVFTFPARDDVYDVTVGKTVSVSNGKFRTEKYHTYRIQHSGNHI